MSAEPLRVHYALTFVPTAHALCVEVTLPTFAAPGLEVFMPVWTPGSYLVREYARHVEGFAAIDSRGAELTTHKVRKNRWHIAAPARGQAVTLNYRLYCREMSVRTNFIDEEFALIVGAATFITAPQWQHLPHTVEVTLPPCYETCVCALPAPPQPTHHSTRAFSVKNPSAKFHSAGASSGKDTLAKASSAEAPSGKDNLTKASAAGAPSGEVALAAAYSGETSSAMVSAGSQEKFHYFATDYDTLVDSPLYAGTPQQTTFTVGNKFLTLLTEGGGPRWDNAQAAIDVHKIVAAQVRLWGALPFERYIFFNLLTQGRGGLEHRDCSVLMASPDTAVRPADYLDWLGLVSHEFFHVWNIKRLRPVALGPFDYEAEVPTRSLWIAEGITAYYDDLMVHRAGLCTQEAYLSRVATAFAKLQATPGRLVQSLQEASFDAWIKFYRRDETTDNTAVSYYLKGSLVAFLLDAHIREATDNKKSLDDVMVQAYAQYSGPRGYQEEEFRRVAADVAQVNLNSFFAAAIDTPGDLDPSAALHWYGLQSGPAKPPVGPAVGTLGVLTRIDAGRLIVTEVVRCAAADRAGLSVDDELLALGNRRVVPSRWHEDLKSYPPGSHLDTLLVRRERLLRLPLQLGPEAAPTPVWTPTAAASAAQTKNLSLWLRHPART
jgi:predicted metalloprotease with PDZ domain